MLYTSESSSILSYDICRNQQNSPFVGSLPNEPNGNAPRAFALRIRPNGEVLVATQTLGGGVGVTYRLDASGNLVQTYNVNNERGLFALNLDPDGTTFWTAGTGSVYRVDIASGTIVTQFNTGQSVFGLAIFQGTIAARPTTLRRPTGTPTPTPFRR
jgi:outer membrane protein assembly factor BamB